MSQPAFKLSALDKKLLMRQRSAGFIDYKNPLLSTQAKEVSAQRLDSQELASDVQRMMIASQGERKTDDEKMGKGKGLVGLAGPQIGLGCRIITVDLDVGRTRKGLGRLQCFINPKILWRSRETEESIEGCFSTSRVWGLVRRPIAVKIQAYTPEGKEITKIVEGYTARIFQHEIDHLDGIRFPERIVSDKKRHWVNQENMLEYKKAPTRWPHCITKVEWLEMIKKSAKSDV